MWPAGFGTLRLRSSCLQSCKTSSKDLCRKSQKTIDTMFDYVSIIWVHGVSGFSLPMKLRFCQNWESSKLGDRLTYTLHKFISSILECSKIEHTTLIYFLQAISNCIKRNCTLPVPCMSHTVHLVCRPG